MPEDNNIDSAITGAPQRSIVTDGDTQYLTDPITGRKVAVMHLTADSVGAVPKTGGTFTGAITIQGSVGIGVTLYAGGHLSVGQGCNTNSHLGSVVAGFYNSSQHNRASVFGRYNSSSREDQLVIGEYASNDSTAYFVVGNGTANARSNAFAVKTNGDAVLAGDLTFKPANASEATTLSALVARIEALEQILVGQGS